MWVPFVGRTVLVLPAGDQQRRTDPRVQTVRPLLYLPVGLYVYY